MSGVNGAPRLLLSGESRLGVSRASRDRTLEVAARYHELSVADGAFA